MRLAKCVSAVYSPLVWLAAAGCAETREPSKQADSLRGIGDAVFGEARTVVVPLPAPVAESATQVAVAPAAPAGIGFPDASAAPAGAGMPDVPGVDMADVAPPANPTPLSPSDLATRRFLIPVAGVSANELPDNFHEMRGSRPHAALDILAPRGTAVLSADHGRLLKLHTSDLGGITIYATDPSESVIFYYAHLDGYAQGVTEGMALARGDTIGFVGSTGNAAPNAPHLHFGVALTDNSEQWWSGTPVDPRPLLGGTR